MTAADAGLPAGSTVFLDVLDNLRVRGLDDVDVRFTFGLYAPVLARVAAGVSMLSVPTPARTIALRRRLPSSDSPVILTPLRQTAPSKLASAVLSSSPLNPV